MAVVTTNLGVVTAYGDAVEGGYTGTKEQWQALMADYGTIGTQAQQDAQTASTAAQTATTKASEASASATQAQQAAASVSTPDTTLTQSGKAADAKATGDEISALKEDLNDISIDDDVDVVSCGYTVSSGKITNNPEKYVSIMFPCVEGGVYTVNRVYGNRFTVLALAAKPASGVVCQTLSSDKTITTYTFTATSDIKYVVVNLQNDFDTAQNTHEEILESCSVTLRSAKDDTARSLANRALATLGDIVIDANKPSYWVVGGLGSSGEAYPSRNYNISTSTYMQNVISVITDEGYATRYALYNASKGFIYRSAFEKLEIDVLDLLKTYNATYVKFEVEALDENGAVITTQLEDVSRYSHVHLYTLRESGIETEDATKWYQESATQAEILDRIKQAKYVYSSSDAGVSSHPVLTLLHFSDVHANLSAMQYALDINNTFGSDIDDMLHTGDVVAANFSDGIANWVSSGCAEKVLNVIGNHDTEANLVLQAAGKDNVYNTIFAPYISSWGVTQPTGVDTSGSDDYHALYYYKDYAEAEVRLIVLDTNFWDNAQKAWLTSVLADAKTNGLCVVIACHDVKLLTEMTDSNFSSYKGDGITETSNAYANQPADWLDPVNDFINNGGSFACILAGHNHSGHMGTMTNYPNIFVYVIDKASVSRVSGTARKTGTKNANAVSIVVVNPVEKLLKIVKIGAQTDAKMRPRNVFCYDFANHRIVSQW